MCDRDHGDDALFSWRIERFPSSMQVMNVVLCIRAYLIRRYGAVSRASTSECIGSFLARSKGLCRTVVAVRTLDIDCGVGGELMPAWQYDIQRLACRS